jgi:glycosyltransferase involved in cell wall biosynthesis
VIFAQMIAPRHLSEWIGWFRAVNRGGRLVLHLGYDPYRFGRVPACDRVMFVSDSVPLAATYGRILGVRVHVLDHVVDEAIQPCLGQREGGPTRFVSLGSPRREKGFGEILRAIDILRESTEVMFRAQTHGPDADSARCLDGFDRPSTTTFLSHHLSDQEYRDALAVADVVLLPYHLNCYRERTSGVFCEAMVAGKPVITTRGSWMGGEVERSGAGWLVGECDSSGLAAAISLACRERERAAAVARDCAVSSRKRFDAGTFLTGLSRLLDDGD